MQKKLNEKGSFSYFFVFIVSAIILVLFFAFMTPLMMIWNTSIYESSEVLFEDSLSTANDINNASVKAALIGSTNAASTSITDQVDILSIFFQYAWLIVIFVLALIYFLFARQQVESGGVA